MAQKQVDANEITNNTSSLFDKQCKDKDNNTINKTKYFLLIEKIFGDNRNLIP